MHTVLPAKRKLHTTPDQFRAVRQTQLAYRDALNVVSRYAFAHGKLSNQVGVQEGTYQQIRAHVGLPAQMACSLPRQVGATYQALWTKLWTKLWANAAARAAARAARRTKKRYGRLDPPPKYVLPTLT